VRLGPHVCNPFSEPHSLDGRFLAEPPERSRRAFATATSDAPQSRLLPQNARRVPLVTDHMLLKNLGIARMG
jgi:hypothetical protein